MKRALMRTGAAVLAGAVLGGIGTKPKSAWYLGLDKPDWQPPAALFGPVWTTLYGLIAYGSARGIAAADTPEQARSIERALWANLALNAGWSWAFFTAQNPALALAEIAALNASNADLIRRVAAVDRKGALALAPYAAWVGFASVLNAELLRRNPS